MTLFDTEYVCLLLFERDALLVVIVLIAAVFLSWFKGSLDRQRIQTYVEERGGKVLDITYKRFGPGWFGSNERIYDVTYRTHHGKTVTGTCKTGMFSGVYWTDDVLPAGLSEDPAKPAYSASVAEAENTPTPAEPIKCLECGATIPARASNCAKCGWSYDTH